MLLSLQTPVVVPAWLLALVILAWVLVYFFSPSRTPSREIFASAINNNSRRLDGAGSSRGRTVGPGYHLKQIPRGVLGQVSKIQEELDELSDAVAQRSLVMALVESADLVGALQAFIGDAGRSVHTYRSGRTTGVRSSEEALSHIQTAVTALQDVVDSGSPREAILKFVPAVVDALQGYLAHSHPGIELTDLETFSQITKRAFANGHRAPR